VSRIGLLSDSHGRAATTRRAVRLLIERGVEMLIHLGDVESPEVLDALVEGLNERGELQPAVRMVFGNVDYDAAALTRYAESLGIVVDHPSGWIEAGGKRLVYTHGDRPSLLDAAMDEEVDYLCHGHTHKPRDERIGPTRLINPGALFRASHYSTAVLDPAEDHLQFVPVPHE
jgi:putative phosphoesterase